MPRTNYPPNPKVSTAGWGKQGYCRLCSIIDPKAQRGLDQRIKAGQSASLINRYLQESVSLTVNRQTIYKHIEHVKNPKDRLVTAVQRRQAQGTLPATVSEDQFLDALVAVAHQKVTENPDDVTIDHGLRAAQIKQQSRAKGGDVINALVQIFTALPAPVPAIPATTVVVEAEYLEIPEAN